MVTIAAGCALAAAVAVLLALLPCGLEPAALAFEEEGMGAACSAARLL